jgi:hypothetical protein
LPGNTYSADKAAGTGTIHITGYYYHYLKNSTMKNIILICSLLPLSLLAQEHRELAIGQADATVDLRTHEGADAVKAVWKYREADIVETEFKAPGPGATDPLPLYPCTRPD